MHPGVKSVKPLADHKLLLVFDNRERRVFDVTPWLTKGAFCELQDEAVFRTARVSFDTVEWANGCDLCPELLYADSEPVEAVPPGRPLAVKALALAEGWLEYKTARGKGIARRRSGVKRP